MSGSNLLKLTAIFAFTIGIFCIFFPYLFLEKIKLLKPHPEAIIMTRTGGILFITLSFINYFLSKTNNENITKTLIIINLFTNGSILISEVLFYRNNFYNSIFSILPSIVIHFFLITLYSIHLIQKYNLKQ